MFQDCGLLTDRTVEKNLEFALGAAGWNKREKIKQN